jgi:two-component system phosphate regulon sensor histidine kinase PhoR
MELLLIILLIIIGLLLFLLLKKERVLGINTDDNKHKDQIKIIESKDYRKNIYNLLDYFPEEVLILDKSKKILFNNKSSKEFISN